MRMSRTGTLLLIILALSLTGQTGGRGSAPAPDATGDDRTPPRLREAPAAGQPATRRALPSDALKKRGAPGKEAVNARARRAADQKRAKAGSEAEAFLNSMRSKVEAEEKAWQDAENKKIQQAVAQMKQGSDPAASQARKKAIQEEALAIEQRAKGASPAQRAKDAARVDELYQEFMQLGP